MNISPTRRQFLTAAGATAAAVSFPNVLRGAAVANNAPLKIGLIGCGGRGTGAIEQALLADPKVSLWAVGDAFATQVDAVLDYLQHKGPEPIRSRSAVDKARQFSGLDAFQKVIDSGVDMVILTTPPGFRPQHFRAAVEANKHVFSEKPMAVDIAGVKSVMETAKLAKQKNLAVQHGFCWRSAVETRAGYRKLLNGDLGAVIFIYSTYLSNPVKAGTNADLRNPDWGDVEWQVRNWQGHQWLSGGPLVEQGIHTIDKVSWAMKDVPPIAARASGGRMQRTDDGNTWDHYDIVYEYPDGVFAHVAERQFTDSFAEVTDRVFCEKGTLIAPSQVKTVDRNGTVTWRHVPGEEGDKDMYQIEHDEWFASIRKGEPLMHGEYMANITMLGLLGREAAHTGQRITWEQMWEANYDMAPDNLKMSDKFPVAPVPVAGKYKLV